MGSSHLTDEETKAQFLAAPLQGSRKERSLHLSFRDLPSSPKGQVPAWPHLSYHNPLLQKGQGFILTGVLAQVGGRDLREGKKSPYALNRLWGREILCPG